jgi:VPDSG-CTERM motif
MKTLILATIRCLLMFTVTASLFSVRPAQAYTVTLEQVGANVVANGSGAINLTRLTFVMTGTLTPGVIVANVGIIQIGESLGSFPLIDQYIGISGPTSFGSGGTFLADAISGDFVGIFGLTGNIDVPPGYVSDTPLSDSMTFNNATFASLGVTPGTYTWTWGTGLPNQNFTVIIGVPDGGSTVSLLGCALLGLAALRRRLGC